MRVTWSPLILPRNVSCFKHLTSCTWFPAFSLCKVTSWIIALFTHSVFRLYYCSTFTTLSTFLNLSKGFSFEEGRAFLPKSFWVCLPKRCVYTPPATWTHKHSTAPASFYLWICHYGKSHEIYLNTCFYPDLVCRILFLWVKYFSTLMSNLILGKWRARIFTTM